MPLYALIQAASSHGQALRVLVGKTLTIILDFNPNGIAADMYPDSRIYPFEGVVEQITDQLEHILAIDEQR